MPLFEILGGVALILYAIRILRKGLTRIVGNRLHEMVEAWVSSRPKATGAGLLFGALVPSSTTQTIITIQLLRSGKLPLDRMLSFLTGAGIGITIMVQLIAFRIFEYYPLFLAIGIPLFLVGKREVWRGTGQSLLGLGLVFSAITLLSNAGKAMAQSEDLVLAMQLLENHPLLLTGFAMLCAVCLQSSTAVIGLAIGLAEGGIGGHSFLVHTVLGANIGLTITMLIVAWPKETGRILAVANMILKLCLAAVFITVFALMPSLLETDQSGIRLAANLHSGFNLLAASTALLFGGVLVSIGARILPENEASRSEMEAINRHLDPAALATPAIALANAARETLDLVDMVRGMYSKVSRTVLEGNPALLQRLKEEEDQVDLLQDDIKHYLSSMETDEMSPAESRLQFGLLHFATQLEESADIIDRKLQSTALRVAAQSKLFHETDLRSIHQVTNKVDHAFAQAITVLTTRERKMAKRFLKDQDRFKSWVIEEEKRHYQLLTQLGGSYEQSTSYLAFLHGSRRIAGLIKSIGHTFAADSPKSDSN